MVSFDKGVHVMCELRYGNDYPDVCPPSEAARTCLTVYRGVHSEGEIISNTDFIPVFEIRPKKIYDIGEECGSKALSFWKTKQKMKNLMRRYPKLGTRIIEIDLNEECGLLIEDSNGHCNLWDYSNPDIVTAIGENWREV